MVIAAVIGNNYIYEHNEKMLLLSFSAVLLLFCSWGGFFYFKRGKNRNVRLDWYGNNNEHGIC